MVENTMQPKPTKKYYKVGSLFYSSTLIASLADARPSLPLKNLPGPKTEQVALFKIAQS